LPAKVLQKMLWMIRRCEQKKHAFPGQACCARMIQTKDVGTRPNSFAKYFEKKLNFNHLVYLSVLVLFSLHIIDQVRA